VGADDLPVDVTAEPLDVGLLPTTDGDAEVVSEKTASGVRSALGRAAH
jgi:hypothetical protein